MHCLGLTGALGFIGLIMLLGALGGSEKRGAAKPPPTFMDSWGVLLILGIAGVAFAIWVLIERRKNGRR